MSKTILYVGSYTSPDKNGNAAKGVYVYDFDTASGKISLLQTASEVVNPSYVTVCPETMHLYVASEGRETKVASYKICPETGLLTYENSVDCSGSAMCHVATNGKAVYTSQYGSGHISAVSIEEDGKLGKVLVEYAHEGKGVNPRRQEKQHAHSVTISPDGKYAYACDLGMDKIMIYKIEEDGSLSPNAVPFKEVAPGEGPRHMEFHPNGKYLYLVTEMGAKVVFYTYDEASGALEAHQMVATLPQGYDKPNTAADIHLTNDGKYLYMSNRGIDELVCFQVAEDGMLTKLCSFSSVGGFPRSFALSPDNRFVAIGNQDGSLNILSRDAETGVCSALYEEAIPMCVCTKFFTL